MTKTLLIVDCKPYGKIGGIISWIYLSKYYTVILMNTIDLLIFYSTNLMSYIQRWEKDPAIISKLHKYFFCGFEVLHLLLYIKIKFCGVCS